MELKNLKLIGVLCTIGGTLVSVIADKIAKKVQEAELDEKIRVAVNNALNK